ncbi:PDZ domain-containing protein [Sphingomonas sp. RB3P16]|uniref:M48 family metalloprotease n=1 Tax=Parasphingomonas frigoris TaxID=3096163 RepID=UPI002FC7AE75
MDDIGLLMKRQTRVQSITRRILTSNLRYCQKKAVDYGFTPITLNRSAPPNVQRAGATALHLGDGYTVLWVAPDSPALKAGIRVGDEISAVNGVTWAQSPDAQDMFRTALASGLHEPRLQLTVRRADRTITMEVQGQDSCDVRVIVVSGTRGVANASGNTIRVDTQTEQLLSDDQLAFIIGHEAAHIFLGHAATEQQLVTKQAVARFAMEQAADALGVRLMLRAGYAPEAAAEANTQVSRSRGPFTRLLNLHGNYMKPKERSAFLAQQAEDARREAALPDG